MPDDPLPQYAGLFAEWPEYRPRHPTGLILWPCAAGAEAWYWTGPGGDSTKRPTLLGPTEALAICRSAAIDALLREGQAVVPLPQVAMDRGRWGVVHHGRLFCGGPYMDAPTFDHACIAALRAVRGEGK